jgi:hypothetical protein
MDRPDRLLLRRLLARPAAHHVGEMRLLRDAAARE